jgi:DNA primase
MCKVSDTTKPNSGTSGTNKSTSTGNGVEKFAHIKDANRKVRLLDVLRHYGLRIEKNYQRPIWSNNIICPLPSHKGAKERTPSFGYCFVSDHAHCLAGETKVLLKSGTVPIKELCGQTHLVLGKQANWVPAQFKSYGFQDLWEIILTRNGQVKVIRTTADHRWFVRSGPDCKNTREVLTKDLKANHRLAYVYPRCHTGQMVLSPFGIAHGFVFGDGIRDTCGCEGYLHGEKDTEMRKWFPFSHIVKDNIIYNLLRYFKDKPSLDEYASYLYGWLAGYFAADGCVADDGQVILNSANKENLEFARTLCTRLGIATYGITGHLREGSPGRDPSYIYGFNLVNETLTPEFFLLSAHRKRFEDRRGWVVRSVRSLQYAEEVFCAEVEDGHAFALEDNILTGNCLGCGFTGRAVEFISKYECVSRTAVAERILSQCGDNVLSDNFNYEDDISPVLLDGSKFLQELTQKYKNNPKILEQIHKLTWWFDFYLMQKAPGGLITVDELKYRIQRIKDLLSY